MYSLNFHHTLGQSRYAFRSNQVYAKSSLIIAAMQHISEVIEWFLPNFPLSYKKRQCSSNQVIGVFLLEKPSLHFEIAGAQITLTSGPLFIYWECITPITLH